MSPVIILGLVLMWAVVLVPMWLRRHDEAEENRSVDRFSTAMRTLSRRAVPADGRYVVMPHRTRAVDVHVSGAAAAEPESAQPTARSRGGSRRVSAATRRRRTLIGLLVVTVLALVSAVVLGGAALWTLQLLMDVALVGFVWRLRAQARVRAGMPASSRVLRTAAVSRQRHRAAVAPPAPATPAFTAEPVAGQPAADEPAPAADPVRQPDTEAPAAAAVEPAATTAATAGEAWQPVPVPRPTYTMKPAAPARRRRAAPLAEPAAEPAPEPALTASGPADADDGSALDEILTHRWAVND